MTWGAAALVGRVVANLAQHTSTRRSMRDLLRQMAYVSTWLIGITVAAMVIFPGILILGRFPFEPSDFIECES